jgi:predicted ATPase
MCRSCGSPSWPARAIAAASAGPVHSGKSTLVQGLAVAAGFAPFFHVAARVDAEKLEGIYGGTKLHEPSHAESFLALAAHRFGGDGLYVLDEPEAALSVTSALGFIDVMHAAAGEGARFVVATHSPILLACPGARIFEVSEAGVELVSYEQVDAVRLTRSFIEAPERFLRHLL